MARRSLAVLGIVAVVAVVAVAIVLRQRGDADSLPPDVGVVEFVVDGDTVELSIGGRRERVRMIGVDTPELHVEDGPPECFGQEAAGFTEQQLPAGTEVRLVRDVVGRDHFDRLLAYVYRRADDVFVNQLILANGYARPLTIAPNDAMAIDLVAAATAAEAAGLGLWTACR
jgi:micrococcal nuclease